MAFLPCQVAGWDRSKVSLRRSFGHCTIADLRKTRRLHRIGVGRHKPSPPRVNGGGSKGKRLPWGQVLRTSRAGAGLRTLLRWLWLQGALSGWTQAHSGVCCHRLLRLWRWLAQNLVEDN